MKNSKNRPETFYTTLDSPLGTLRATATEAGLRTIMLPGEGPAGEPDPSWTRQDARFEPLARQLEAYFQRRLQTFDLPLALEGTEFQKRVWQELMKVPYGTTSSYAEIARRIGRPSATRAVGAANGRNPLPIIVPCHRIIGHNGSLTGYGGGLAAKRLLLELEGAIVAGDSNLRLFR